MVIDKKRKKINNFNDDNEMGNSYFNEVIDNYINKYRMTFEKVNIITVGKRS